TERGTRFCGASWAVPDVDGGYLTGVALAQMGLQVIHDPPAVVLAEGPRFANFVAARRLADAWGSKLVLRYQDEWTVNTPSFVQATADDHAEERRCLSRADLVAFVTQGKQQAYARAFPDLAAD